MRLGITTILPAESTHADNSVNKPDVVFLHGTGSGSMMWQPQTEILTGLGYRCFLPDWRGHGKTPEPAQPTNIEVHVSDLIETLDHAGVRFPAVFIGHSLGAMVALTMAQRHPEIFDQIFAAAMPGKILQPLASFVELLLGAPYEKLRGTSFHQNLSWRPKTLIDTDRFTLLQIIEHFKRLDYISETMNIQCPVHFAAGRFDPVALSFFVEKMHKLLPGSTFKMFEMSGHNFMDMYPETFNAWLLQYLEPELNKAGL